MPVLRTIRRIVFLQTIFAGGGQSGGLLLAGIGRGVSWEKCFSIDGLFTAIQRTWQ
jgi:hypothetical protein